MGQSHLPKHLHSTISQSLLWKTHLGLSLHYLELHHRIFEELQNDLYLSGIISDDLAINADIQVNDKIITLNSFVGTNPWRLGNDGSFQNTLELSQTEIGHISTGHNGVLRIGTTLAEFGSIDSVVNITSEVSNLSLIAGTIFDDNKGGLVSNGGVALSSIESIDLTSDNNDFNIFAANSSDGDVSIKDINLITIGEVDGVSGITADRFITVTGDSLIKFNGGNIRTTNDFTGRIELGMSPIEIISGPLELETRVTSDLGRGDIILGGAVTSATQEDLILTPGVFGTVFVDSIGSSVGEGNEIGFLEVSGNIEISGREVITSQEQQYIGSVLLRNDVLFHTDNGSITFQSGIEGAPTGEVDWTLASEIGNVIINGNTGGVGGIKNINIIANSLELNGSIQAQGNMKVITKNPLKIANNLTAASDITLTIESEDLGEPGSEPFIITEGKITSSNGSVTIEADDISLIGGIEANDIVFLRSNTETNSWVLGGSENMPGILDLSEAELNVISSGSSGKLQVGTTSASSGKILSEMELFNSVERLGLSASTISDDGIGSLVFPGQLDLETGGNIELRSGINDVNELSVSVLNPGSMIIFKDIDDLLITELETDQSELVVDLVNLSFGNGPFIGDSLRINLAGSGLYTNDANGILNFKSIHLTLGGRFGTILNPININSQSMEVKGAQNPRFDGKGPWVSTTGTVAAGEIKFNNVNGPPLGIGLLNSRLQFQPFETSQNIFRQESALFSPNQMDSRSGDSDFENQLSNLLSLEGITLRRLVAEKIHPIKPENWSKIVDLADKIKEINDNIINLRQ